MDDSSGSSTVTMPTTNNSLSNSAFLSSSHSSINTSKRASPEISKTYKQASQLYLTRRLSEAFTVLEPVITPPTKTNGHTDSDEDSTALAPVASAVTSQRIKIWSLYITLLNGIVDLGFEEGSRNFGAQEYKSIVSRVRDGDVWEQVVRDGYRGKEGSVDAEVIYNLATLLLGQAPNQHLNQSRLETYLASASQPELDLSSHLTKSPTRRLHHHTNGTDTPRELTSRLKILELFTLHVLPRNEEWDYAKSFITNSDILDDERREAFLQTLQELQETVEAEDLIEEGNNWENQEEDGHEHPKVEETRKVPDAAAGKSSEQIGGTHKRTSSEVDYGIEKSHPNGTSAPAKLLPNTNPSNSATNSTPNPVPPAPSVGRTQVSPRTETPKHRNIRKSTQSQSNNLITQAQRLVKALQRVVTNLAGSLTANPTVLFRTLLFVLAFLIAFSRREVRERARRIAGTGWEKIRSTIGMGVKVSYI